MIRVWSGRAQAGVLARLDRSGSTFAYAPGLADDKAVSLTMPVRVQSWDWRHGLLPIFDMNLPEGALKERLLRRFAKAAGQFDDLDLLSVVGRTQLGRLRYSGVGENLDETVPYQSVDDILRARRDGGLYDYLLEEFARYSGVSGVQPKVLIRDESKLSVAKGREPSIRSATHIVKFWDPRDYPELAANEYFCLIAARKAGLPVPETWLSETGEALVVERFDLSAAGEYLGLEDFCVLNGVNTAAKYKGGYETKVFKRLRDFVEPAHAPAALKQLYRLFVLNCALRNGDAHLKNFALLYPEGSGCTTLAPVYDLVTTTAYLPRDAMALTLDGSASWPDRGRLMRLGQTRADLSAAEINAILEQTADALNESWPLANRYFGSSSDREIGERIGAAWRQGIRDSLGLTGRRSAHAPPRPPLVRPTAASQVAILDYLEKLGGPFTGTLQSLAHVLNMPQSTVSQGVRLLASRGFITRQGKTLTCATPAVR
ncbi:MAG: type II toxin-antitoxin system HipA family toxin [Hyphomicrobiales bacterium]|nr:type II toxin-antitoxin system HipA family toxin [Hyphomicrobiales bacterium]